MKRLKRLVLWSALLYILGCTFLYFRQDKFIFRPHPLPEDQPLNFQGQHEEVEIPAEEGLWLNSALFRTPESKGLVLFYHGNTGNIVRYEGHVREFTSRGWDVLTVDYRSFGKSDGELSHETLLSDGLLSWDYCREQLGYDRIAVYGQSLGTSIASYIASKRPALGLVLEAPFYSMTRVAQRVVPFVPIEGMIRFPLPSYQFLANVDCPILAFHGTVDRTIPYEEHGLALKSELPAIDLITIEGGGHSNCRTFPVYAQELDRFLIELTGL